MKGLTIRTAQFHSQERVTAHVHTRKKLLSMPGRFLARKVPSPNTSFARYCKESATETKVLPFEEARNQIANKVYQTKQQAEFETYMRKLRASALIDWKVPELKKVYDEQVARMGASQTNGASQ